MASAEDLDNREPGFNVLTCFKNNSLRLGLLGPTLGLSPTGGRLDNDSFENDADDADDAHDDDDDYLFDEESEYFNSEPLAALTDPFAETQQVDLKSDPQNYWNINISPQCCCFPVAEECPDPFGSNSDLISLGVLNSSSPPSDHEMEPQDGLIFRFAPIGNSALQ